MVDLKITLHNIILRFFFCFRQIIVNNPIQNIAKQSQHNVLILASDLYVTEKWLQNICNQTQIIHIIY